MSGRLEVKNLPGPHLAPVGDCRVAVATETAPSARGAWRIRAYLKHFSSYAGARYFSEALFFFRGIALAGILGPIAFGIWTQMKLVLVFLQYGQLGVHEALMREVPLATGAGKPALAHDLQRTALTINLTTSSVLLIVVGLIGYARTAGIEAGSRMQWLTFACLFPLSQLYWYMHVKLRAEKRFTEVSRTLVVFAVVSTGGGTLAARLWGVEGFLIALAAAYVLAIAVAEPGRVPLPRPAWRPALARLLMRTGLPIMASGALLILLWNVDKLAIWLLMPPGNLGVYALPVYLVTAMSMMPETVAAVLYPDLMERVATAKSTHALAPYLVNPMRAVAYVTCPLIGVLFLTLHLPLRWFLPDYAGAIVPGQILLAAALFPFLARLPFVVLIALNRRKLLVVLTALPVVVAITCTAGLIHVGAGLPGAALGAALGLLLHACLVTVAAVTALNMPAKEVLHLVIEILRPYGAVCMGVVLALLLFPQRQSSLVADLYATVFRCLVVLTLGLGVAWVALRRDAASRVAHGDIQAC